ncbi:MAG: MFS transporter [Promethearchaeota archaeon]|nr:MAG: MFS transporter [Candidatus Lokiarchaeota archaeon]
MNESFEENKEMESRHPQWRYASNALFQFPVTLLVTTLAAFMFFYYEAVLGLNAWYIFLAVALWTIWDAVNDPLIAFLVDRNTRLTRRFGRRFPWIVIGITPWCLCLYLVFSAPDVDASTSPWILFWWLLISLVLFDTFRTLVEVNLGVLRPDLFRTEEERRQMSKYFMPIDMIAIALGMIIPPLFLSAGAGREGFAFMGAMVAFLALIGAILFLPGAREDKTVIDRYFTGDYEKMSFFKGMKEVVKLKSFLVYFVFITAWVASTDLMIGNTIFLTIYVVRASPDEVTILFATVILGALFSIPFWIWALKRMQNNKKLATIGGFSVSAAMVPISFFQTIVDLLIILFILGFCLGSLWAFIYTIIGANVQDDYAVKTGKNQKAILVGTIGILGRLAAALDEFLIATVHTLTGFEPGHNTYESLASAVDNIELVIWGIRLLSGVIPAIIIFIGTLVFWKFYPLSQEEVLKNKRELEKLGF